MDQFELITKKFETIGSRLKIEPANEVNTRYNATHFTLNVRTDRKGELFLLHLGNEPVEFLVPHISPRDRHLVLMAKPFTPLVDTDWQAFTRWKFLCGHDERHWFVASVPPNVSSVEAAKEALKPEEVLISVVRHSVRRKKRHCRKNAAFIRQGEWFFIPAPEINPDASLIFKNEPIRRSGGTPHYVDQLYRCGGITVYVCPRRPHGLTEKEYTQLVQEMPKAKKWNWQMMVRNPKAYARGRVRHRDHKTICLLFWHRIIMNVEFVPKLWTASNPNVFLD